MTFDQWESKARTALCLMVLAALPGCASKQVATAVQPVEAQAVGPQAAAKPAEPKEVLLRMARYLAGTPRFSVVIKDNYDVLQKSGQMIEFSETRQVLVSRPDHLRVEVTHSDGDKHVVLYDGKDITVFSPEQRAYAQSAKPGGIDAAIMYFLKDLQMRLPLAALMLSRFPEEIEHRTQSLNYVERTQIEGMPAHHLAGRTETVDYQFWIAEGDRPLPLRAVLTYKNADGDPQFRAQFTEWNLSPQIQDSQFAFMPPEGTRKITFLAELPRMEIRGATDSEQTGGLK
jgi:hypothetical protein